MAHYKISPKLIWLPIVAQQFMPIECAPCHKWSACIITSAGDLYDVSVVFSMNRQGLPIHKMNKYLLTNRNKLLGFSQAGVLIMEAHNSEWTVEIKTWQINHQDLVDNHVYTGCIEGDCFNSEYLIDLDQKTDKHALTANHRWLQKQGVRVTRGGVWPFCVKNQAIVPGRERDHGQ